jgi:hypothetical protein
MAAPRGYRRFGGMRAPRGTRARRRAHARAARAGYRQIPLWLNRDELAASISDLHGAILPRLDNKPGPDRGL